MKYPLDDERGVAALLTIVIVSAAALVMAASASFLGLGELDLGYTSRLTGAAFAAADGCVEETLRRIRLDPLYGVGAGTQVLTLSDGSCTVDVAATGDDRTVVVVSTVDAYHAKLEVALTLTGTVVTVTSWEEKDT